jgi:hypothetical protein
MNSELKERDHHAGHHRRHSLLIAWLLGVVGTYTIGVFVHVFLVIALVLFVVGLLGGRRSLA